MPTQTTNFQFYLPLVNNATDQDLWGGYLNTNFSNLDTLLPQLVPAGQIAMFPSQNPPTGFLLCDGRTITRASYANLWTFAQASGTLQSDSSWTSGGYNGCFSSGDGATTFRIPDLRGWFVRAWDGYISGTQAGAGVDTGRVEGTTQSHEIEAHVHFGAPAGTYVEVNVGSQQNVYLSLGGNTGSFGGSETRPINTALMFCIKT